MVRAITGGGFGDEGKGKITDLLASEADMVVRFQGGANAGHTIINDYGKFVLRQLPSGVFYRHTENIIASGTAFDAEVFFSELEMLREKTLTPLASKFPPASSFFCRYISFRIRRRKNVSEKTPLVRPNRE